MAVSKYFNNVTRKSEQDLFEDLVIEQARLYGYDIYYIPRTILELDSVLGDPVKSVYENAYKIEALIPTAGNYAGENFVMSKFGFRTNELVEILIAKRRFRELGIPDYIQPKNGDLIYIGNIENPEGSFSNDFFEINNVTYDAPGFQFGKQFCYKLYCESFTFSHERIRTGIDAIDSLEVDRLSKPQIEGPNAVNEPIKIAAQTLVKWDTGNPFGDN